MVTDSKARAFGVAGEKEVDQGGDILWGKRFRRPGFGRWRARRAARWAQKGRGGLRGGRGILRRGEGPVVSPLVSTRSVRKSGYPYKNGADNFAQ